MDLRQLRYFVTVAEERNITRAAERLNMAQPPLSRQIKQLEEEIGTDLFDRSARPLELTKVGRLVLEQALQVLGRMSEMRTMVDRAIAADRRRLSIGFVASTIYARLPPIIRELRASDPDLDLVLLELVSLDQVVALKDGRIDVGFGRLRFEDDSVRRIVLRKEPLVVAIPSGHRLATEKFEPITLQELEGVELVLYPREPRPSYADQVLRLLNDAGVRPQVAYEVRELQIAIGLVAAGEGVCVVPESVAKAHIDGVSYRSLPPEAASPIIMNHRHDDRSLELRLMADVILRTYEIWGYPVPDALRKLAEGEY
jgi:DNA-binding transcriptional LysR family regulator